MFEATQGKGVWEALPQEARDQYVHMVGVITGASKDPLAALRALVAEVEAEEADGGEPNENSEEPTEAVEAV
jgi:hypothetical protein